MVQNTNCCENVLITLKKYQQKNYQKLQYLRTPRKIPTILTVWQAKNSACILNRENCYLSERAVQKSSVLLGVLKIFIHGCFPVNFDNSLHKSWQNTSLNLLLYISLIDTHKGRQRLLSACASTWTKSDKLCKVWVFTNRSSHGVFVLRIMVNKSNYQVSRHQWANQ